jgi:hypothetical protein
MTRACLWLAVLLAAWGCAPVASYQRGYLARPDMGFEESPGMAKAQEKVFVAKEASSGSATVGGSGCGCN